jgi:hypothetical protein
MSCVILIYMVLFSYSIKRSLYRQMFQTKLPVSVSIYFISCETIFTAILLRFNSSFAYSSLYTDDYFLLTCDVVQCNIHISTRLSLLPVAPTLVHRASVKRFVSLQFLNPKRFGKIPWTGDQPVVRPLPISNIIKTDKHSCLEWG